MLTFGRSLRAVARNGPLSRVLVAYTLYDIVEFAAWLAVILFAYAKGGTSLAALVAVVQILPAAFISPPIASIGDKLPRGRALALAHAGVAVTAVATTVALMIDAPVAAVIACSTVLTIALAVVRPIHYAAQPGLARSPDQLVSANALSSIAEGVAMFAGPAIAGAGVAIAGPALVLGGSAVAGAVAALLCMGLRLGVAAAGGDPADSGWRGALRGLTILKGDAGVVALLLVMATRFFIAGAVDILGVTFNTEVLHASDTSAGLLVGAIGIGAVLGGVVAGSTSLRSRLAPVVTAGAAVQGIAFGAVAFLVALIPAMAALAISGLAAGLMVIGGRTLLQRSTDDRVLARVFAVQEGVALLGVALGAAAAPVLVAWLGPADAFIPIGAGAVIAALGAHLLVRRLDSRAILRPQETALLRQVPFLVALPPYDIERLAANATWIDVDAGVAVVRQGDPGDRFYVIDSGRFTIQIDGHPRPGYLGPGAGFGEMALLTAAPRNATVTAVEPGRLLAVTADDFLSAVVGEADGTVLAEEVARQHAERDRRAAAEANERY